MTISYEINIPGFSNITADGDGEIIIAAEFAGDYSFSIDDFEQIRKVAHAHFVSYQLYKNRGFENEQAYHTRFKLMTKA